MQNASKTLEVRVDIPVGNEQALAIQKIIAAIPAELHNSLRMSIFPMDESVAQDALDTICAINTKYMNCCKTAETSNEALAENWTDPTPSPTQASFAINGLQAKKQKKFLGRLLCRLTTIFGRSQHQITQSTNEKRSDFKQLPMENWAILKDGAVISCQSQELVASREFLAGEVERLQADGILFTEAPFSMSDEDQKSVIESVLNGVRGSKSWPGQGRGTAKKLGGFELFTNMEFVRNPESALKAPCW